MIILGVDPGLTIAGFCLLETNGKKINLHAYGTIKSDTKDSMPNRLKYLFEEIDKIIREYAPRKVKLSVCGSGAASKEQVSFMVMKILKLEKQLKPYDISDSIAVGLCFINQERLR